MSSILIAASIVFWPVRGSSALTGSRREIPPDAGRLWLFRVLCVLGGSSRPPSTTRIEVRRVASTEGTQLDTGTAGAWRDDVHGRHPRSHRRGPPRRAGPAERLRHGLIDLEWWRHGSRDTNAPGLASRDEFAPPAAGLGLRVCMPQDAWRRASALAASRFRSRRSLSLGATTRQAGTSSRRGNRRASP